MIITIDGPTASGKSTVAQELAKRLGIYYLGTGYLYRALAYLMLEQDHDNDEKLAHPDISYLEHILCNSDLVYCYDPAKGISISYKGQDLTSFLKNPRIDKGSSILSANPYVRELLLEFQRRFAQSHDLVTEGRDCGSVVFPDADIKFYLTATPAVRAQRWMIDQQRKGGNTVTFEQALKAINERDERDSNRDVAPLVIPQGAIVIDNSNLDSEQTLANMLRYINRDEILAQAH